jgi:hypothetical protein
MAGIKDIPAGKLVALQFADPSEFRRAARFVAENKIRADAPGRSTLIVRISDRHLFEDRGFKFREFKIVDPEHVSSKTLSRLSSQAPSGRFAQYAWRTGFASATFCR